MSDQEDLPTEEHETVIDDDVEVHPEEDVAEVEEQVSEDER